MKKSTTLALALCLALTLVACSKGAVQPSAPVATPGMTAPVSSAAPAASVVHYGIPSAWDALMPYNSPSGSNYSRMIYDKIYDRLAFVNANGTLSPRAANTWERADDGMAAVFHLNEKAAFHDGTPVTAQNWVETITLITTPACPALGRSAFAVIVGTDDNGAAVAGETLGITAVDAYTLKIAFKAPTTPEDFLLDKNREYYVLPTHLLKDTAPADIMALDLWNAPIGSGPCTFVSEVIGSQLTLAASPTYQLGTPGFGQLVITVMDKANLLTALIAGDLDYFATGGTVSAEDAEVAKTAQLTVMEDAVPSTFYELMLNGTTIPDPRIRRAIELALDKDLLCQQTSQGLGVVTDSDVLPGSPASPEVQPVVRPRDLAGAQELLAQAGYDGSTFKLACSPNRAGLAALMQQNLKEAGIETSIETVDSATMFAGVSDGIYAIAIASHTPGPLPLWFTESRFTADNNLFHVQDLTAYTQQIKAIKDETDSRKRRALVASFEDYLMSERPFIPLWFATALRVQSPTVTGIDYASASYSNENVWQWVKP